MALTDVRIRQAKPAERPYRLSDSGGLFVEVRPNGSKLWRYAYRLGGRQNLHAIGSYPDVGLQEARAAHAEARALVASGENPSHARARVRRGVIASSLNTLKRVAEEWFAEASPPWSAHYLSQVRRALDGDLYPRLGFLPVKAVTSADLLVVVRKAMERGPHAAAITLKVAGYVYRYAIVNLHAEVDPTYAIRGVVKRPRTKHASPKSAGDIRRLLGQLAAYGGSRTTAIAVELMLLLFVRTRELRTAPWSEFDMDAALWMIPPGRMKMGRAHLVPLQPRAVHLLHELRMITGGPGLLFPNTRDPSRPMSAMTINRALEYMGFPPTHFTGHDFRATASTWLHEQGFSHEAIEMQLAHAEESKSSAPYNHALYLPARREMMLAWSSYIDELRVEAASQ